MKFLLSVLLTMALALVAGLFLPWWSVALVSFLVALMLPQHAGRSFLAAFISVMLLWGGLALWIDQANQHVLSQRMSNLFPLHGNTLLLTLITALVGALLGGFAAMTGSTLRPIKT